MQQGVPHTPTLYGMIHEDEPSLLIITCLSLSFTGSSINVIQPAGNRMTPHKLRLTPTIFIWSPQRLSNLLLCNSTTQSIRHALILSTYLLTHLLTYYIEQSPSEANRFSTSHEIPRILWNPNVRYRIHKCSSFVPILSQLDPVHAPTSYFLKIHLNIILPSMPGSSKWSLSLKFPHQNPVYASLLPHKCYMPSPSHSSRFDYPNKIW